MWRKEEPAIPSPTIADPALLDCLADPRTERMLLPTALAAGDNSRRIRHYKCALRLGMARCLTDAQREQLRLHYSGGLRKSEIARRQRITCSAVCKSIKAGEEALRAYIEIYMSIYDSLEQEFLQDQFCL